MWRPSARTAGPLLYLSALCLVTVAAPAGWWPPPRPGDSYVFDPPLFSAIWVQRTGAPALAILANALILVGLAVLFRRDSPAMSRWQRLSGQAALLGTGLWLLGTLLVDSAGADGIVGGAIGVFLWFVALLFTLPGLVGLGVGYLQSGRTRLGAAIAGTPLLTILYLGVSLTAVEFQSIGGLLLVGPTAVMVLVVGHDLRATDAPDSSPSARP